MFPDFSTRCDEPELLDEADLSASELEHEVAAVDRFNRWLGGDRTSRLGLESLIDRSRSSISILDVGTGGGSLARRLVAWGRQRGHEVDVHGIDLMSVAVERARHRHGSVRGLTFSADDLFDLERDFDVVHACLVLHHFPGRRARRALEKMNELAEVGVVVNDLHRHPLHWAAGKVVAPLVTTSEIARHDGPLSIRRAFTRQELEELAADAGFERHSVSWQPPFRWLLTGE